MARGNRLIKTAQNDLRHRVMTDWWTELSQKTEVWEQSFPNKQTSNSLGFKKKSFALLNDLTPFLVFSYTGKKIAWLRSMETMWWERLPPLLLSGRLSVKGGQQGPSPLRTQVSPPGVLCWTQELNSVVLGQRGHSNHNIIPFPEPRSA